MYYKSFVTKTLCFADFYDEPMQEAVVYLRGIHKDWLISAILHMISVISYDSFSMRADRMLHMIFQDYMDEKEVHGLFGRLMDEAKTNRGVYLTFINHKALFELLRSILLIDECGEIGESLKAYIGLLKAILAANSKEMEEEANTLKNLGEMDDIKKALVVMQQDLMNNGVFGDNYTEVKKTQELKFIALDAFAKSQPEVYGNVLLKLLKKKGFEDAFHYWLALYTPLSIYHDTNKYGEGIIRMSKHEYKSAMPVWDSLVSSLERKCLDINNKEKLQEILSDKEMLDQTCFKKYPVLKLSENEYVLVSMFYYAQTLYDGLQWELLAALKKEHKFDYMSTFSTDFSEKWMFCKLFDTMKYHRKVWAVNDSRFEDKDAAPDITINTKRNIFMFEFKDMRVKKEVADGRNMNELLIYIDKRLNHKKDNDEGNKGIPQLVRDMEDYFNGLFPPEFKGWNKNRQKVHPILVINSRVFTSRGVNQILQIRMRERIEESEVLRAHKQRIDDLLLIDYDLLVILLSKIRGDVSQLMKLKRSYTIHTKRATDPMERYISFRGYVMRIWEKERNRKNDRKLEKGFKEVTSSLTGIDFKKKR